MITTTKYLFDSAEETNSAIAAFNCYNAETIQAAIAAGEKANKGVIIAYGERYQDYMNIEAFAAFTKALAEQASIPVSLHLDHSYKIETIERAIACGFSSVMYDGSALSLEENVKTTKHVVDMAHAAGVFVEAEIGSMEKGEFSDEEEGDGRLTDPDEAAWFVKETNVDFLAASIGTVHGMYKGEPKLELELLEKIRGAIQIPLVLHGGSGTPEDQILKSIDRGIRKINVNTEISLAAVKEISNQLQANPSIHLSYLMEAAQNTMIDQMYKIIELFKNN
ncbi:class II fructose-bisphosphate aldolase [Metabacillus fastidiosus]|uniref:Class II fructose-bisphosphate aldolase n=1 Tax=Metabacillus fastidiosus TaxID=1458 RepID=A0ABU6NXK7_9BACI|nr:class II fructose-bisphosphate aldolase [Metabacillus fastidiosus]MEC2076152.1 class II fructose-bisphosphate aldolase [Metabacillus fastidiosus]MED4401855.1 class II fructose-bisphosphate aldolase [Metabacillus fastidiosus]MED4454568.1 class II fructose-bisphosphate aldolase [Metabacillus fastidiosus]MED4461013.1 class II fructose-bisphosphate aldolase [Metabacillus fastidiosus]